jgi:hypothetical protein
MVSAEIIETATSRKLFAKKASSAKKINAMGGLSISDSTSGGELANDVPDNLVAATLESKKLPTILRPAKQNAEAMITITSSPDHADVEIDGVFYGNTGAPFKVPTGLHAITVTLPGYDVWEKKVMVKEGLTFDVRLSEKVDQKLKIDIKEEVQKK